MDYLQFKEELYNTVAGDRMSGKRIRILEKNTVAVDAETLGLAALCQGEHCGGREEAVGEDTLCIVVGNGTGEPYFLCWDLRILYERFARESWQGILPEIFFRIQEAEQQSSMGIRMEMAKPILHRLILRPLNYARNREEVENGISHRFGDIALVLHMLLHEDAENRICVGCNRGITQRWRLSDKILLANALLRTSVCMPLKIIYPEENIGGRTEYRLTTAGWTKSAVSLFYPGVQEQLACRIDGDYYVGFLSTREVLIYPVRDRRLGELKEAVLHAKAVYDEKEFLTDRLYRYSSEHKRLIEV